MSDQCGRTSAIICSYTFRRWQYLCQAIRSLQMQTPAIGEIIVVVDHNKELEAAVREQFPSVIALPNSGPPGTSGAKNSGISASQGDFLLFLDDDARLAPGHLEPLLRHFSDENVIGVTAHVRPIWTVEAPSWFPREFLWVIGCTYDGQRSGPVRNLLGSCMVLRRSAVDKIGGFETGLGRTTSLLPMGGEETEICIRAKRSFPSAVLLYDDGVYADHVVHTERVTLRYFTLRCFAEGLSKAHLVAMTDAPQGLSTERQYVQRVLAKGLSGRLRNLVLRRDWPAAGQAGAIVVGLAVTGVGYGLGRAARLFRPRQRGDRASFARASSSGTPP